MKKAVLTVLAWLVFVFLILVGIPWSWMYLPAGVIILLAALLIFPPLGIFLQKHRVKGWMRATACLVLAVLGLYIAGIHVPQQTAAETVPEAVEESVPVSSEPVAPVAAAEPVQTMEGIRCSGTVDFPSPDVKRAELSFTVSDDYTELGDISVTLYGLTAEYPTAAGKAKAEIEKTSVDHLGSNPVDITSFAIPFGKSVLLYGSLQEDGTFTGTLDYTFENASPAFSLPLGIGDWTAALPDTAPPYAGFESSSMAQSEPVETVEEPAEETAEESADIIPQESAPPAKPALDYPATGVLSDMGFAADFGPLKINTGAGNPTYIKIYTVGGQLVKTLFIRAGDSVHTNLGQGSYVVKYASGDTWYGEEEMFGDTGVYQKADTVLEYSESGVGYELTLENVVGGNLGSVGQNKDSF